MSLVNQHWISFDGEPITGRAPTQIIVMNGTPPSEPQYAGVLHAYKLFTDAVLVTPSKFLTRDRVLQDGTRVRLESMQGQDRVLVWPTSGEQKKTGFFVAYPAYYDLSFCPVFNRTVFDSPSNGGAGDPPVYVPFRLYVAPAMPVGSKLGVQLIHGPAPEGFIELYVKEVRFVTVVPGSTTFGSSTTIGTFETYTATYGSNLNRGVGLYTFRRFQLVDYPSGNAGNNADSNVWYTTGGPYSYTQAALGQPVVTNFTVYDAYIALRDAHEAEFAVVYQDWVVAEAAASTAYSVALAAHKAAFAAAEAAWAAANAGGSAGPAPLLGPRKVGRATQITALKAFLDAGVQPPHLMARNLALPFNIGTKPASTLATTGSLIADANYTVDTPGEYLTFTATDVMHLTPPVSFGKNVAHSTGLFSWKATGTFQLYQNYPSYHRYENKEVRPRNLSTLTFTERDGYTAFANGGFISDAALDLTINSDAYLPPGTSVLIAHYEYEAFDPYTNEWVWTPCIELFGMDSIWIKSLGDYSLPVLASQSSVTPRALRVRAVTQQERNLDWSWTTAVALDPNTLPNGWSADQPLTDSWQRSFYPSAVVLIEGMDSAAEPIENGTTLFLFGARHLWSGDQTAINESLEQPWATAIKIEKIIAHALKIVGEKI